MTEIFHLSLPVRDMAATRRFYETFLDGRIGRVSETWLDVWVFGAQITLQQLASDKPAPKTGRAFHLGATVSWDQWMTWRRRLEERDAPFAGAPMIDEERGQAKLYLNDPDGYVIELKAYIDIDRTLAPPL